MSGYFKEIDYSIFASSHRNEYAFRFSSLCVVRLKFVYWNFHVILTNFDCGYVVKGFSNDANAQNQHTNSQTKMPFHY